MCDYVVRDHALAYDVFPDKPGQLRWVDILPSYSADCHLCQMVHHDENPSVARSHYLWQIDDAIRCDTLPLYWWCLEGHVDPMPTGQRLLHSLAEFAATDILKFIWVHWLHVQIPTYQNSGFRTSKITGLRVVMVATNHCSTSTVDQLNI
jgi:hypothetical protein